jgi:hypothetical protein
VQGGVAQFGWIDHPDNQMGKPMYAGVIDVEYRYADGWHLFTSRQLKGLYVANRDAETAYNGVGVAIEALLRLNEKLDVRVQPADEFEDFLKDVRRQKPISAPVMKSGHYVVERRCA